jgi:cytochrome c-type biogenesis protein CcmE
MPRVSKDTGILIGVVIFFIAVAISMALVGYYKNIPLLYIFTALFTLSGIILSAAIYNTKFLE